MAVVAGFAALVIIAVGATTLMWLRRRRKNSSYNSDVEKNKEKNTKAQPQVVKPLSDNKEEEQSRRQLSIPMQEGRIRFYMKMIPETFRV